MKTARHSARTICACALALLSMVPASLVYGAADDPVILDIGPYVDEEGFGGFLRVLVRAPADSSVVLKKASAPDDPVWTEVGVPLLSTGLPVDLAAPIDPGETEAFFRAEIVKTDMFVRDDGTWITFVNNDVAPVGTVLHRLSMFSGLPIFPRDDDTADNELPAVQVASMNVEDLLKNLGIDAWVGPPPRTTGRTPPGSSRTRTISRIPCRTIPATWAKAGWRAGSRTILSCRSRKPAATIPPYPTRAATCRSCPRFPMYRTA